MPDHRLLLREAKPLRRQPVLIHDAGVQRGGGAWVVVVIFFIVLRTSALATFRRLFVIVFPVFVIVFTAFLAVFVRLLIRARLLVAIFFIVLLTVFRLVGGAPLPHEELTVVERIGVDAGGTGDAAKAFGGNAGSACR